MDRYLVVPDNFSYSVDQLKIGDYVRGFDSSGKKIRGTVTAVFQRHVYLDSRHLLEVNPTCEATLRNIITCVTRAH